MPTVELVAIVFAIAAAILFLGLAGRKVQSVAYDVSDRLVLKDGSGVSKRNLESFTARIVPGWAKFLGWGASFASLVCWSTSAFDSDGSGRWDTRWPIT